DPRLQRDPGGVAEERTRPGGAAPAGDRLRQPRRQDRCAPDPAEADLGSPRLARSRAGEDAAPQPRSLKALDRAWHFLRELRGEDRAKEGDGPPAALTAPPPGMRVVRHPKSGERPFRSPVIALGNLDGCHRGHATIVELTRRRAKEIGGEAVVYTFAPHPVAVLKPERAPVMILSLAERLARLRELGVDGVVLRRFTRAFAALEPERFVREI